ncbi:MAG: hypothetical protein ACLU70_11650 [Lachnospira sp.]
MMDGDMDIFFGIIGSDEVLLKVASDFAMEDFQEFDMDAYDAVCELLIVRMVHLQQDFAMMI